MDAEIVKPEPVAEEPKQLARVHVFATSGDEMAKASEELSGWFARRVEQERAELAQLEQNLVEAKKHKWNTKSWQAAIGRARGVLAFYEKGKEAVESGYCIVPDMNANWFAVRTTKESPPRDMHTDLAYAPNQQNTDIVSVAAGEGRYVGEELNGQRREYKNAEGKMRYEAWNNGFNDWQFPVTFVRPEIIDATARAMEMKIFDAFGLVGGKRKDPMIVAKIVSPGQRWSRKEMHFIIGWFLDTRTL